MRQWFLLAVFTYAVFAFPILSFLIRLGVASAATVLWLGLYTYYCDLWLGRRAGAPGDPTRTSRLSRFLPPSFGQSTIWPGVCAYRALEKQRPQAPTFVDSKPLQSSFQKVLELGERDFISSWTEQLAPDEPALLNTLHHSISKPLIESLRLRVEKFESSFPSFFLTRLLPVVTDHFASYRKAEAAVRGQDLERNLTETEETRDLLCKSYRQGMLHPAVFFVGGGDTAYLRKIAELVLPALIPEREYKSGCLRKIMREIVVCSVLKPAIDLFSDPDYLNQSIDALVRRLAAILPPRPSKFYGGR
jgi:sorting nexin-25